MRTEREHGGDGLRGVPTGALFREFLDEGQTLVREEVRIAKAEIREEARKAAKGGAGVGVGGAFLYASLLLAAATLVFAWATFLPGWAAALIVTAIYAVVGAIALAYGRAKLKRIEPARPAGELKEDARWARETMRDVRSSRHARG